MTASAKQSILRQAVKRIASSLALPRNDGVKKSSEINKTARRAKDIDLNQEIRPGG
jgi:hypothetical protein